MGGAGLSLRLLKPDAVYTGSPGEGSLGLSSQTSGVSSSSLSDVSPQDSLPPQFSRFADIFHLQSLFSLPPHRPGYNMKIDIKPDSTHPYGGLYFPLPDDTQEWYSYIEVQLAQGNIRQFISPAAAPIFFVKVPGTKSRPVVDCRSLKSLAIRGSCPIPLLGQFLTQIFGRTKYAKIDLKTAFNTI